MHVIQHRLVEKTSLGGVYPVNIYNTAIFAYERPWPGSSRSSMYLHAADFVFETWWSRCEGLRILESPSKIGQDFFPNLSKGILLWWAMMEDGELCGRNTDWDGVERGIMRGRRTLITCRTYYTEEFGNKHRKGDPKHIKLTWKPCTNMRVVGQVRGSGRCKFKLR